MTETKLNQITLTNRRQQVYQMLRDAITQGSIAPGTRLIGDQLAKEMGVSRTPLREALQQLETEGFVKRLSTGVSEVTALTRYQIEEIFAIRAALEGLAAKYAAIHATPDHLKKLEGILYERSMSVGESAYVELDECGLQFHAAIQEASGLYFVNQQLDVLRAHINRHRARTIAAPGRRDEILREHDEILKRISERDAEGAENAMRAHIYHAWLILQDANK